MTYTVELRGVTAAKDDVSQYRLTGPPSGLGFKARQAITSRLAGGVRPVGTDVLDATDLSFEVAVVGDDDVDAETLMDALSAAWAPSTGWSGDGLEDLTVTFGSGGRVYRGRPVSVAWDVTYLPNGWVPLARLVFAQMDPLWYGANPRTVSVAFAAAGGGFDTPMVTPLVTVGSGFTGDVALENAGSAPAPWTGTITATTTLETPRLILGGKLLEFDVDLPAGATLSLDSSRESVTLEGSVRPYVSDLVSSWWSIPSGQSTLSARAANGTGVVTVTWRDASY